MSPNLLNSDKQLFRTLGHELIHAWHSSFTPFWKKGDVYINLTEADILSSLNYFNSYFHALTPSQLSLYHNRYHWTLNNLFKTYK